MPKRHRSVYFLVGERYKDRLKSMLDTNNGWSIVVYSLVWLKGTLVRANEASYTNQQYIRIYGKFPPFTTAKADF